MKTIKFQPDAWVYFAANEQVVVPAYVQLRLSEPGTVEAQFDGEWLFVGYGDELKIQLPASTKIRVNKKFAVFVGINVATECVGTPLTNFDKRPGESGVERMVKQALREAELDRIAKKQARLEQDRKLNRERFEKGLQVDNPVVTSEPEPEPEPTPEPDTPAEPPAA